MNEVMTREQVKDALKAAEARIKELGHEKAMLDHLLSISDVEAEKLQKKQRRIDAECLVRTMVEDCIEELCTSVNDMLRHSEYARVVVSVRDPFTGKSTRLFHNKVVVSLS